MIVIQQTTGSSLSDLLVDEVVFQTETGLSADAIMQFVYNGAEWELNGDEVTISEYGITYTGTPVSTDAITVAFSPSELYVFQAGKGINMEKLNHNFASLQQQSNSNETEINNISATALKANGSNVSQTMIDDFNKVSANILVGNGNVNLTDNSVNFLTLTGNSDIILPTVPADSFSHTIIVIVAGSLYSLNLGTMAHLLQNSDVDTTTPYSVMYIYNKIDNQWYYCITQ
jgi:hypothetical protein